MRHLEAPGRVPRRSHICPGSDFQAIKFHNFSVIKILSQPPRIAEGADALRCGSGTASVRFANVRPPQPRHNLTGSSPPKYGLHPLLVTKELEEKHESPTDC